MFLSVEMIPVIQTRMESPTANLNMTFKKPAGEYRAGFLFFNFIVENVTLIWDYETDSNLSNRSLASRNSSKS
jgi:hypothetical protein